MKIEISITYYLRDGTSDTVVMTLDFLDGVNRSRCVVKMLRLMKGGYVSFIELSKIIAQHTDGVIVLNPIVISKFKTQCFIDDKETTLKHLLHISDLLDMGKSI